LRISELLLSLINQRNKNGFMVCEHKTC
jgi:hypothetical protein